MAGAAKLAFALYPGVFGALKPDIAHIAGKAVGDGMRAVGIFGAIHAAPRQQTGQARDGHAKYLLRQDVVHARWQVGDGLRQPHGQAAGDLAQEHARFGERIQKAHGFVRPQIGTAVVGGPSLGQQVQHPARQFWRGKHFVVG